MQMNYSNHSDWGSIHRLSNKKTCTERVDCFPANVLLSKIANKFITSTILAVMISSAEMHRKLGNMLCDFFKKVQSKIKSVGTLEKNL